MEKYRNEFRILSSDTDMYQRLRLSRLFILLQEAAIAHTEALGAGREKTLDRGILWAVALQRVDVKRLPVYDEKVTLFSWPGETMHVLFPRYTRLCDEKGNVLIEASALWILMDAKTRARVFPEETGIELPGMDSEGIALPRALRTSTGETALFTVPYSYIDLNGHMNNACLPDLAEDMMPEDLRTGTIIRIEAEYTGEIRAGDQLNLHMERVGKVFTFAACMEKPMMKLRMEYA